MFYLGFEKVRDGDLRLILVDIEKKFEMWGV